MSDAPETIWAGWVGDPAFSACAIWFEDAEEDFTQYTRTDTIDAIKAQVWQEALNTRATPKVKALVWVAHGDGVKSQTLLGEYIAVPTANTRNEKWVVYYICPRRKSWTIGYVTGAESAKAAAQADYERRILEALCL